MGPLMIEIVRDDKRAIVRLVLNRPEKANALTESMLLDLLQNIRSLPDDTRVLILSGKGKVFSAGADLDAAAQGLATSPLWEELSHEVAALDCLTIAALNGTVAGGACGMVLACDLRLAVPFAKLFYPVMRLGYLPQPSDPARLRALVGPARAKMVLMGGAKVSAEEALAWGLFDRIVAADEMDATIEALSADVLEARKAHVAAIKAMI